MSFEANCRNINIALQLLFVIYLYTLYYNLYHRDNGMNGDFIFVVFYQGATAMGNHLISSFERAYVDGLGRRQSRYAMVA